MIPVILSGGSGTRLWPVSRQTYPKQFCDLLEESLFSKTIRRLEPLGSPWVVTVEEMKTLTERSVREHGIPTEQCIYEPFGKNTAPAVALVCKKFELLGESEAVVGVFPADHLIDDERQFANIVSYGESLAKQGNVVTLGIQPTFPATGYGYIETVESKDRQPREGLRAVGFREKPNEETSREFLSKGGFYWNAGMFIFRVNVMIELFKKYAPDVWNVIADLTADMRNIDDVYKRVRSISIDYAIMEKLPQHICLPCNFAWSDLGSWDSLSEVLGSVNNPLVEEIESSGNFIFPTKGKTYGLVRVDDLVIVDTADALLIAKKGETELVKQLVDKMKADGNARITEHRFEMHTWGRSDLLSDELDYKANKITVDPCRSISWPAHDQPAHFVLTSGSAEVLRESHTETVTSGCHLYIPPKTEFRVTNIENRPLHLLEIRLRSSIT